MIYRKCKIFLSQKSQCDRVEKLENKNKNRTRASLFQSSEDAKQEFFYVALGVHFTPIHILPQIFG